MCEIARAEVCIGKYGVGRVIARPFVGTPGAYQRVSAERKDYALQPPAKPLQTALREAGVRTVSVGKISDLFGGVGFDESYKTKSNEEGVDRVVEVMRQTTGPTTGPTFVWVNLVDFDQEFGHRNDPEGFAGALEAFDRALPAILAALPEKSALVITADHGNDPTTPGTDHSREYVPVLYYVRNEDGKAAPGRDLGIRATFADHAATVASYFEAPFDSGGSCF